MAEPDPERGLPAPVRRFTKFFSFNRQAEDIGQEQDVGNSGFLPPGHTIHVNESKEQIRETRAQSPTGDGEGPQPQDSQAPPSQATGDKASGAKWDDPSNKLWKIYVDEAKEHDEALIESWKVDTEGTLIFSGLFSAVITAFLLEMQTLAVLLQISAQMAAGGSALPAAETSPFTGSSTSAVWVNSLWIVSLALALTSALLSTLIQQWSRDYFHAVTKDPVPRQRSRIRIFLFEGVETFRMRLIVASVPLIIQLALFLFLAGLVVYIAPMDNQVFKVTLGIVVAISGTYGILTMIPVIYQQSPFKTPISPVLTYVRAVATSLYDRYIAHGDFINRVAADLQNLLVTIRNLPHTISPVILKGSYDDAEVSRDIKALQWLVNSKTESQELEDILELIPDFLAGFAADSGKVTAGLLGESEGDRLFTNGKDQARLRVIFKMLVNTQLSSQYRMRFPTSALANSAVGTADLHITSDDPIQREAVFTSVVVGCAMVDFCSHPTQLQMTLANPQEYFHLSSILNSCLHIPTPDGVPPVMWVDPSKTYLMLCAGLMHAIYAQPKLYEDDIESTRQCLAVPFKGFVGQHDTDLNFATSRLFLITSPVLHGRKISEKLLRITFEAILDTRPFTMSGFAGSNTEKSRSRCTGFAYAKSLLQERICNEASNRATCQQLVNMLTPLIYCDASMADPITFSLALTDLKAINTPDEWNEGRFVSANYATEAPTEIMDHAYQFVVAFGTIAPLVNRPIAGDHQQDTALSPAGDRSSNAATGAVIISPTTINLGSDSEREAHISDDIEVKTQFDKSPSREEVGNIRDS